MTVLAGVLLLPAGVAAVLLWLDRTWTAGLLLVGALIPPMWFAVIFARVLNGADIDGSAAVPPIVLSGLAVVGLWVAWYRRDPKGAGQALAVAEGAAAIYHVKHDHPVLGAVTGVSAVDQWQRSSARPPPRAAPVVPADPGGPMVARLAEGLRTAVDGYLTGGLSDSTFMARLEQVVAQATQASSGERPQDPAVHPAPAADSDASTGYDIPSVVQLAQGLHELLDTYSGGHLSNEQFMRELKQVMAAAQQTNAEIAEASRRGLPPPNGPLPPTTAPGHSDVMSMATVLVVDDQRTFPTVPSAVYARSSAEAVVLLDAIEQDDGGLSQVLLDYDLGLLPDGAVDDVRPVMDWLEQRAVQGTALPITEILVVPDSPGTDQIKRALSRYYKIRHLTAEAIEVTMRDSQVAPWGRADPVPGPGAAEAASASPSV